MTTRLDIGDIIFSLNKNGHEERHTIECIKITRDQIALYTKNNKFLCTEQDIILKRPVNDKIFFFNPIKHKEVVITFEQ